MQGDPGLWLFNISASPVFGNIQKDYRQGYHGHLYLDSFYRTPG